MSYLLPSFLQRGFAKINSRGDHLTEEENGYKVNKRRLCLKKLILDDSAQKWVKQMVSQDF